MGDVGAVSLDGAVTVSVMVTVGLMIKAALERAEMSQQEAARLAQCSAKHLNQVINGHQSLSIDLAVRLQRELACEPEWAERVLCTQVRTELAKRRVTTAG